MIWHQLTNFKHSLFSVFLIAVILLSAGCNSEDTITDDSRSINDPFGFFTLHVKDAPVVGPLQVVLSISQIEMKPANGSAFTIDVPPANQSFDLMTLIGSHKHTLISDIKIPSGDYEWIKLVPLTGTGISYVRRSDGGEVDLVFQEDLQTTSFNMFGGFTSQYMIDIDLRKGLVEDQGEMRLRSALSLFKFQDDVTSDGALKYTNISGVLGLPYIEDCESPGTYRGAVYLFSGDVEPDDIDLTPGSIEPYVTAPVSVELSNYNFGYIPRGQYTIAYTCDVDDPEIDESTVVFAGKQVITFSNTDSGTQVHFIDI